MDSGVGTLLGVNSYVSTHRGQEHPLHWSSSGRKRKLQLEQLALPTSKQKLRHQLDPDESSDDNMDESEAARGFHWVPEHARGSSSSGGSGNATGDLEDHAEMSPKVFVPRFESWASPLGDPPAGGGFGDRVVENSKNWNCRLHALDASHGVDEPDCQLPKPGADEDEDEFIEEEEGRYGTAQELMLSCCDEVGLHTLGISTAKWNVEQDALPGTVRPTIDKEFEEYFSMLML